MPYKTATSSEWIWAILGFGLLSLVPGAHLGLVQVAGGAGDQCQSTPELDPVADFPVRTKARGYFTTGLRTTER